MAPTIPQRDLRNSNAQIIDAVVSGESFVITRNGEPVAELKPYRPRRRTFVPSAEIAAGAASAVRIDPGAFRADLDRVVDQQW